MGLNQFADMTDEELQAKYTTDWTSTQNLTDFGDSSLFNTNSLSQTNLPSSVDHRRFAPTTILHQGICVSCWAFATAMTAEIAYNKRFGVVR